MPSEYCPTARPPRDLAETDQLEQLIDPPVRGAGGRGEHPQMVAAATTRMEVGLQNAADGLLGAGQFGVGVPPKVALPTVAATRPTRIRSVVVLPAPFGPRKPVTRPGSTVKLRLRTATAPP